MDTDNSMTITRGKGADEGRWKRVNEREMVMEVN